MIQNIKCNSGNFQQCIKVKQLDTNQKFSKSFFYHVSLKKDVKFNAVKLEAVAHAAAPVSLQKQQQWQFLKITFMLNRSLPQTKLLWILLWHIRNHIRLWAGVKHQCHLMITALKVTLRLWLDFIWGFKFTPRLGCKSKSTHHTRLVLQVRCEKVISEAGKVFS